jgi:hypothetical protein
VDDKLKAAEDPPNTWEELIQAPTKPFGFVERYFDSGLRLEEQITRDSLVSREIDRITRALILIGVTGSIPRRLGSEATNHELAIDKKRSKRVEHVLRQALAAWSKKDPRIQVTAEIQKEGIQLEWSEFVPNHMTQVMSELTLLATWSIQNDEARWGRTAVVSLENELRWLSYAMRD